MATIPTTAVISPRGHESWWSRRITQARINGATAAASSSQRRMGNTSHAVTVPRAPSMIALRLSGLVSYQGRKRLRASARPPSTARNSPRPRRLKFIRAGAYKVAPRERRAGFWTRWTAALLVGGLDGGVRGLPRRRVGAPGARRARVVREGLLGGVPVRAVVDHDPAQARALPRGLCRLRPRGRGGVPRAGRGPADGRRGDRPQPGEDPGHDHQRPRGAGRGPGRARVVLCARVAAAPAFARRGSTGDGRVQGAVEGAEAARVRV